ncbi:MAG: transposase [Prolixibacteraceae bacterium]|nr:transposase [Prolixibacteraceae bacterium]
MTQRVFQIAAGYEDCNDLRGDMILKTCAGRLPQTGSDLASQPTMSRLENAIGPGGLIRMGKYLLDAFVSSYASGPVR